jgi:hypothetical protein
MAPALDPGKPIFEIRYSVRISSGLAARTGAARCDRLRFGPSYSHTAAPNGMHLPATQASASEHGQGSPSTPRLVQTP